MPKDKVYKLVRRTKYHSAYEVVKYVMELPTSLILVHTRDAMYGLYRVIVFNRNIRNILPPISEVLVLQGPADCIHLRLSFPRKRA